MAKKKKKNVPRKPMGVVYDRVKDKGGGVVSKKKGKKSGKKKK